jgi:dipeptidyl aminopeptidase/acylaminoacyl peptidase
VTRVAVALVAFYGYGDITGTWVTRPSPFYNQRPMVSADQASDAVGNPTVAGATGSAADKRFLFYVHCRQQGLWSEKVSGHALEKDRDWYAPYEPVRNVTAAYPPTMLLHGESDADVPFEQSVLMAQALEHHGVDHEFLTNAGWGHMFDASGMEDQAVQDALGKVISLLDQHTR